jgi:hypothetical protein
LVLVKAEAYADRNKGIKSPLDMLRRPWLMAVCKLSSDE